MQSPPNLDLNDFGWEVKPSTPTIQPMYLQDGQSIVPNEVPNLISCGCRTGCKCTQCSCTKFNLACTDFCKSKGDGCANPVRAELMDSVDEDSH